MTTRPALPLPPVTAILVMRERLADARRAAGVTGLVGCRCCPRGSPCTCRSSSRHPTPPPLLGAQVGQDVALAALIGGNLFGRTAMHPALSEISDVRSAARCSTAPGAATGRSTRPRSPRWSAAGRRPPGRDRAPLLVPAAGALIGAKDVAVGAVVVTGLASAAGGVGFAQQAPDGAVPMDSGTETAAETPPRAAALKRSINILGGLNLAAEVSLIAVDALLDRSVSRGPARPLSA